MTTILNDLRDAFQRPWTLSAAGDPGRGESTCCSASGRSGCSPPATGWATCAGSIRQYGRTAETVFPSGAYLKGGTYGEDVNLPIPVEEQNNPNSRDVWIGMRERSVTGE